MGYWLSRATRFLRPKGDRLNALRRRAEMLADQGITLARWKLGGKQAAPAPFDGTVRFGLVTVNFSTTAYLKLMLLTLAEQRELSRISRIVLVDNDSRDGGKRFCRALASACPTVHTVENRFWVNHARGLRSGVAELARVEAGLPASARSNVLLVCDTDIIFRNADTLRDLAQSLEASGAAFCGELRHGLYAYPEAQASFFALRRDAYQRPDVAPFVHHGAPAYWTQRSLWKAGLPVAEFPSNRAGYILHRGRSGVAATREYRRHDAYATARNNAPHFMGIVDGEAIWAAAEARHAQMLIPDNEVALIEHLAARLVTAR